MENINYQAIFQSPAETAFLLESIIMIGAIPAHTSQPLCSWLENGGRFRNDRLHLRRTLAHAATLGFCVVEDTRILPLDLCREQDFLTSDIKADAVILCNLFHPRGPDFECRNALTYFSDFHFRRDIWRQRLHNTGAKLIVSMGYPGDGLTLDDIMGVRRWKTPVTEPEINLEQHYTRIADTSYRDQWGQFMVAREYLSRS